MKYLYTLVLFSVFFTLTTFAQNSNCARELAETPSDFPDKVWIKTKTESFTHQYYIILRNNQIWIKPTDAAPTAQWILLGQEGRPRKPTLIGTGELANITQITADGDNLIAIDDTGLVYYMKFYDIDQWMMRWGLPFGSQLRLSNDTRAIAISHRGTLAGGYEDIDGNSHPVSAGVTTFYALNKNGDEISYADPWLNNGFDHLICGPLRGKFKAINLSASASTIFVIDKVGSMWTRLADFDTVGDDPFLGYTYERGKRPIDSDRTLPAEDWQLQPSILGTITDQITILQTGPGNKNRLLRVEGMDSDRNIGFYQKKIDPWEPWEFIKTDEKFLKGNILTENRPDAIPERAPGNDETYTGQIQNWGLNQKLEVKLIDFNIFATPATLQLTIDGHPINIILHTRRLSLNEDRKSGTLRGMLEIPQNSQLIKKGFKYQRLIDVNVTVDAQHVRINSYTLIPWPYHWLEIELMQQ